MNDQELESMLKTPHIKETFPMCGVTLSARPLDREKATCTVDLYLGGIEPHNLKTRAEVITNFDALLKEEVGLGLENKSFDQIIEIFESNKNSFINDEIEFKLWSLIFGKYYDVSHITLSYEQWITLQKPKVLDRTYVGHLANLRCI